MALFVKPTNFDTKTPLPAAILNIFQKFLLYHLQLTKGFQTRCYLTMFHQLRNFSFPPTAKIFNLTVEPQKKNLIKKNLGGFILANFGTKNYFIECFEAALYKNDTPKSEGHVRHIYYVTYVTSENAALQKN